MNLRKLVPVLLLLLALPVFAQEDPVNPSELELSGTPAEICEAATPAIEPQNREFTEPADVLEPGIDYRAVMCTSAGAIYLDLYETFTPLTVNNFVFLAEQNYYNNTIFHRVIEDFMAQAGDPTGTGTGSPGYRFADEIVGFLTFANPGLLAMANSGPGTNGSQFFITTAPTPWLDGAHTIFGEVLEGQAEAVENILLRDPQVPSEATMLDTVVIIRDPSLVESSFEETAELATGDTFVDSLSALGNEDVLPPGVTFQGAEVSTTEDVIQIVPEDQQEAYAAFLEQYGHSYRATAVVENTDCNPEYFFSVLSYAVDAFESAEAASDALADDFLPAYYEAIGYTRLETGNAPFSAYGTTSAVCSEGEIVMTVDLQRGRYIANVSVAFPAAIAEGIPEKDLIEFTAATVAQVFEAELGDAYRSELR